MQCRWKGSLNVAARKEVYWKESSVILQTTKYTHNEKAQGQ